jgi:oligosaccharide repeat unit polymerase
LQLALTNTRSGGAAAPSGVQRAAELWWLHPSRIVCLALIPVYLSFLSYDFTRVVKSVYIPSWHYAWGLVLMLCLPLGIQAALAHAKRLRTVAPPQISRGAMMLLLGVTLAAYALWFGPLLAQPQLLAEIVLGTRQQVRDSMSTTPGVTTFTQLGVAYAIAYGIKCGAGVQQVSRGEHAGFALVVLLTVFRAFAWAERLAVIEVLVCFIVARMAYLPIVRPSRQRVATLAPLVAPPLLYLLFTASEYFRSWEFYINQYDSVWAFTLDRLITYYATASNNGIGILVDTQTWPHYSGAFAFKWAWTMPGLAPLLEAAFGTARGLENDWLDTFARPEFNSPSAFFRVVLDFGYFGSVLFFLALGWMIGRAYAAFRCGHVFGLLMFPVCVLFLSESLRYSYFAETRFVPLMVGLAILVFDIRRQRRRRQQLMASHPRGNPALPP